MALIVLAGSVVDDGSSVLIVHLVCLSTLFMCGTFRHIQISLRNYAVNEMTIFESVSNTETSNFRRIIVCFED